MRSVCSASLGVLVGRVRVQSNIRGFFSFSACARFAYCVTDRDASSLLLPNEYPENFPDARGGASLGGSTKGNAKRTSFVALALFSSSCPFLKMGACLRPRMFSTAVCCLLCALAIFVAEL